VEILINWDHMLDSGKGTCLSVEPTVPHFSSLA
jgi:hypothetical protein